MATRSRKRKSDESSNASNTSHAPHSPQPHRQVKLKPQDRRLTSLNPPVSKRRTRQQTLTQIDFFNGLLRESAKQEEDDVELELIPDEDVPPSPPKKRKRTAKMHLPSPGTGAKSKIFIKRDPDEEDDSRSSQAEYLPSQPAVICSSTSANRGLPASPRTPHHSRLREVPSSQSPPETPLSIKLEPKRELSRSPLKETSTNWNLRSYSSNTPKKVPKFEIQDTYDASEVGTQFSLPSLAIGSDASIPISLQRGNMRQGEDEGNALLLSQSDRKLGTPNDAAALQHARAPVLKAEIQDSDDEGDEDESITQESMPVIKQRSPSAGVFEEEEEEDEEEDEGKQEPYLPGEDTQAVLRLLDLSSSMPGHTSTPPPLFDKSSTQTPLTSPSSPSSAYAQQTTLSPASRSRHKSVRPGHLPDSVGHRGDNGEMEEVYEHHGSHSHDSRDESQRRSPPQPRSTQELLSTQLQNEILSLSRSHRHSHQSHPTTTISSPRIPPFSSPPTTKTITAAAAATAKTTCTPTSVRLSQATTVDLTQPSSPPHAPPPPLPRSTPARPPKTRSTRPESQQQQTSPSPSPPPPPSSPSPYTDTQNHPTDSFPYTSLSRSRSRSQNKHNNGKNNKRDISTTALGDLTLSQLLPSSFLQESLIPALPSSIAGYDEDDENEDDGDDISVGVGAPRIYDEGEGEGDGEIERESEGEMADRYP
ncbi:MAG: hypothetical protein M1819_003331 [Sarea resinae]|nr:MAG: hypothetical protein M1819_003331 [Sarea resinae]